MGKKKEKILVKNKIPAWTWKVVTLLVVLAAGFILIPKNQSERLSLPGEISVEQAAEKREQGAFFLDVREPEEWQQVHIPGSILIPLGELPDRLEEVPEGKEIVVVCRTGRRSAQGRDILLDAGFKEVTSMAGGVAQWQAQGFETAAGN